MEAMKFNAFISYNHKDKRFARRLQRRLERMTFSDKMKTAMVKGDGYRFRIFRYETDLVTQNLDDGLKAELDRSEYLIVICSPNSAQSYWVGEEIEHFIKTGRANRIIPIIISGMPYSNAEDECYHQKLKAEFPKALLGQDIRDAGDDPNFLGFSKAVAKVASILSGVPDAFDSMWNRYRWLRIMTATAISILGILIFTSIHYAWKYNQEFDISVNIEEIYQNTNLPNLKNVVLTLRAEDMEPRHQTAANCSDVVVFKDIPGRMKGKAATLQTSGPHLVPHSTDVMLRESITSKVIRDTIEYGNINVSLIDNGFTLLKKAVVEIDGIQCISNDDGNVKLRIPYERQCSTYTISSNAKMGVIKMPCTSTEAIMLK